MRKHKREGEGREGGTAEARERQRRTDDLIFHPSEREENRGEDGERRTVCAAARRWRDVGGGAELGEDGQRREAALEGGCNGDSEGARCVASLSPPPPGWSASAAGEERSGQRIGRTAHCWRETDLTPVLFSLSPPWLETGLPVV